MESDETDGQVHANAAYSLLLPGKILYLNALLAMKKFRDRGNKEGAVRGFLALQEAGLGRVVEQKPQRGTTVVQLSLYGVHAYTSICWHTQSV